MGRFEGKLVLLVGGYSGIGAAAARRLADEGASLVLLGRQEEKLRETLATLPGAGHEIVVADAAFSEQLQPVVQIGRKRGGYAGGVVCAGSHTVRPLSVLNREGIAQAFEANVTTALLATAALAKAAAKEGGSIVWFSSVAALRGTATFAAYSAAKGGADFRGARGGHRIGPAPHPRERDCRRRRGNSHERRLARNVE